MYEQIFMFSQMSWVGTEPTTCSAKRRITTNWAAWPVIKLLYTGLFKGKKHDTPISFIILTQHLCYYPQVRSIRDGTWSPFTLTLCRYRPTERGFHSTVSANTTASPTKCKKNKTLATLSVIQWTTSTQIFWHTFLPTHTSSGRIWISAFLEHLILVL